jgi:hypothetical protein
MCWSGYWFYWEEFLRWGSVREGGRGKCSERAIVEGVIARPGVVVPNSQGFVRHASGTL